MNEIKVKPVITTISEPIDKENRLDVKPCSTSTETPVATKQALKPKQVALDVKEAVQTKKPRKRPGYSRNGVKLGRPSKETVKAAKNPVGRPKTDTGIIAEYKQRMLASPKSAKVLEAVLDAAANPDHKNFTAAAKLVLDRILPVSAFEDAKSGGGKASVNITITNIDGSKTVIGEEEEAIEAEFTEEETTPTKVFSDREPIAD